MKHIVTIQGPHFAASLIVDKATGGTVLEAAPILRWALGKRWASLQGYVERKGWSWAMQPDPADKP